VGGVKKCFLGLRQTALLSAEGKNESLFLSNSSKSEFLHCSISRLILNVNFILFVEDQSMFLCRRQSPSRVCGIIHSDSSNNGSIVNAALFKSFVLSR
jgi:hypothetical protein